MPVGNRTGEVTCKSGLGACFTHPSRVYNPGLVLSRDWKSLRRIKKVDTYKDMMQENFIKVEQ